MDTTITFTTYTLLGMLTMWIILAIGWGITWVVGRLLWKRLTRIYHFTVILYWLDRLEKGGWREFQKAEQEGKSRKQGSNHD